MPAYKYLGCVTAFSENGNTQLIQPSEIPMPINRSENSYTERLLGILLLIVDESVVPKRFWASKPYPVLVEKEDAYQPTVKPLNITLKRILKEAEPVVEGYQSLIKPLNIKMRTLLKQVNINDNDSYASNIQPLDITKVTIEPPKNHEYHEGTDTYMAAIKPLTINTRRLLIEYSDNSKDAYSVSIKPLDINFIKG